MSGQPAQGAVQLTDFARARREARRRKKKRKRADDQSINPGCAGQEALQDDRTGFAGLAAEAGRMHAGEDDDAEEAELGAAQGGACAAVERVRSQHVYTRGRTQPAGAFGGADSRRAGEGPAGGALSRDPRDAGFDRRAGSAQGPFEIRFEETEVGNYVAQRTGPRPRSGTGSEVPRPHGGEIRQRGDGAGQEIDG